MPQTKDKKKTFANAFDSNQPHIRKTSKYNKREKKYNKRGL